MINSFENGISIISGEVRFLQNLPDEDLGGLVRRYSKGYLALRDLVRDRTNFSDERELLAACYAVYGWMPRILSTQGDLTSLAEVILKLRSMSTEDAISHVQFLARTDGVPFVKTLNKSVVGTSKLLHFALPEVFPIWDSRIAKLFGFDHAYQLNTAPVYSRYFDLIHEWQKTNEVPSVLVAKLQIDAPQNDLISTIRQIEYCLFVSSAKKYPTKKSGAIED